MLLHDTKNPWVNVGTTPNVGHAKWYWAKRVVKGSSFKSTEHHTFDAFDQGSEFGGGIYDDVGFRVVCRDTTVKLHEFRGKAKNCDSDQWQEYSADETTEHELSEVTIQCRNQCHDFCETCFGPRDG